MDRHKQVVDKSLVMLVRNAEALSVQTLARRCSSELSHMRISESEALVILQRECADPQGLLRTKPGFTGGIGLRLPTI